MGRKPKQAVIEETETIKPEILSSKINGENQTPKNAPPFTFKKNLYGLYDHTDYIFNQDGTINWRAMIKREHLVLNKGKQSEIEKYYEKTFEEVSALYLKGEIQVEDKFLLILLAGIKELAQLRGFNSISYSLTPTPEEVVAVCRILWEPNYETNYKEVCFESCASASYNNTFDFGRDFLTAIAENRALVRAVRNFLRIHIAGQDEVGPMKRHSGNSEKSSSPHAVLSQLVEQKGISFEIIKNKMIEENFEGAETWEKIEDIPEIKVFELVSRVKKFKSSKG